MRDWELPHFLLAGVVLLTVGLIGYLVWFHVEYECVRSHPGTCSVSTCTNVGSNDSHIMICTTNEYACEGV